MADISLSMGGAQVSGLDELLALMGSQLERWDRCCDNRAAFLRVYRHMTGSVRDRLSDGFFIDPAWIEWVAVRFAWWYFDALARYERNDRPPPAWALAFDVARRRRGFLLQDVLLGMNAHINNDLPLVVAAILREEGDADDPGLAWRRHFDHDQINRVLHLVIPPVEDELARTYGRLIRPLRIVMGGLDRALATFGLISWRDNVWRNARFLLAARTEAERRQVIRFIEEDALHVAHQIEQFPPLRWFRPLAPLMRRLHLC